jgi:hypothetical protein
MRSWIKCIAAGVCSAVALASTASFGQFVDPEGAPAGVGGPTYDSYVWPQWQYRGGPKSTSTIDTYSYRGPNAYWYEGPGSRVTLSQK